MEAMSVPADESKPSPMVRDAGSLEKKSFPEEVERRPAPKRAVMPSPTMPSRLKSVLNSDSVLRMSSTREDLSVEVRTEVLLVRASLLMSMREMPEKESAPVRRSVV